MRWWRAGMVLGIAAFTLACGSGARDVGRADGGGGSQVASPVLVSDVPAGFELVAAGRGTFRQDWSEDSTGTHEPFTVLAPEGEDARSDRAVVVSVTGFEGYEGKLDQAAGYGEGAEHFRVDGRPAIFSPAHAGHGADLVVVRGDDLAVRVTASHGTRGDLVAIEARARPAGDHARAPTVAHPPGGLRVVGSVDAGVQVALYADVLPDGHHPPGMPSGYGTGWQRGAPAPQTASLSAIVVRGGAPAAPAARPSPA